ncbi:MAG: hypothetical protein ACOX19_07975 [Fermentimonas sp.]|jgi:hypothetical protein
MIKSASNQQGLYTLNIINSNHATVRDDKNANRLLDIVCDVAAATDNHHQEPSGICARAHRDGEWFRGLVIKSMEYCPKQRDQARFLRCGGIFLYIREVQEKYPVACEFVEFTDWDDFLILARDFWKDDNLIFVLNRKNGLTYHGYMHKLPDQLNKYFQDHSFILIFLVQVGVDSAIQADNGVISIKGSIAQIFSRK